MVCHNSFISCVLEFKTTSDVARQSKHGLTSTKQVKHVTEDIKVKHATEDIKREHIIEDTTRETADSLFNKIQTFDWLESMGSTSTIVIIVILWVVWKLLEKQSFLPVLPMISVDDENNMFSRMQLLRQLTNGSQVERSNGQ